MVIISPGCAPKVLNAYSNIPLQANLSSAILRDFNIGAFTRFPGPAVALTIHDRPDFYEQSSLAIREILDREGQTSGFVLIDANATKPGPSYPHREPFNTAVWWVTSREASERLTASYTRYSVPPVAYPGEAFVLWRARLLTQDLPLQWVNWDIANIGVDDDIAQTRPYDPHDPQAIAYTMGRDFTNKTQSQGFYFAPTVWANYSEIDISQDPEVLRRFLPQPLCAVRLTQEVATEVGLVSKWTWWSNTSGGIPQPGDIIRLMQNWDWDSPKWAGNGTSNARFPRQRRSGGSETTWQNGPNATRVDANDLNKLSQTCQNPQVVDVSKIVRESHQNKLPPPPLQSVAVS